MFLGNTCVRVYFLIKLQAWVLQLYYKRLWHRCFPPVNFVLHEWRIFSDISSEGSSIFLSGICRFCPKISYSHFIFPVSHFNLFKTYISTFWEGTGLDMTLHKIFSLFRNNLGLFQKSELSQQTQLNKSIFKNLTVVIRHCKVISPCACKNI